jgi:hypothetical protein
MKPMRAIARLRLFWELAWTHVILWIARADRNIELKPEVHLYLADVHFRLAAHCDAAGKHTEGARHRHIANRHAALGPPPDLPPAVAIAMPVPQPPTFTDARGRFVPHPPDGVA